MRYWRTVDICGQPYRLYRAHQSESDGHEGWCDFDKKKIVIREDLKGSALEDVLQHELRHGYWRESGLGAYFAEVTKLKGARLAQAEETFIRLDTASCRLTWRAAGLLRGRKPKENQ